MTATSSPDFQGMFEPPPGNSKPNLLSSILKNIVKTTGNGVDSEPDCPDDVEDCGEVLSLCCGASLFTLRGTLPLEVKCRGCGAKYKLGEIIRASVRKV